MLDDFQRGQIVSSIWPLAQVIQHLTLSKIPILQIYLSSNHPEHHKFYVKLLS